jgi:hypothetical protein
LAADSGPIDVVDQKHHILFSDQDWLAKQTAMP